MPFIIAMFILAVIAVFMKYVWADEETFFKFKKSSIALSRKISDEVLNPFGETLVKRLPDKRKADTELMYSKAGFKCSFFQILCINFGAGLALGTGFFYLTNNFIVSAIMLALGSVVPGQVIKVLKNKRLAKINLQAGLFMRMVIGRYRITTMFEDSLKRVIDDLEGMEPIHSEVIHLVSELENGIPEDVALSHFAKRCDNTYLNRFVDFYNASKDIGASEKGFAVLEQAYVQYVDAEARERELKKQIAESTNNVYTMLGFVAVVVAYKCVTDSEYISFMTGTSIGQGCTVAVVLVMVLITWFTTNKVGAPIE